MAVIINQSQKLWVLGQMVNMLSVTEHYSMLEVTTPAGVPGPPPHVHHDASELFLVLQGEIVLVSGQDRVTVTAGQSAIVEPHTLHTFENNAPVDARVLTIFSPSGFEKFFQDIGVPFHVADGQMASAKPAVIERVMKEAMMYHMEIPMPEVSM